ncbi:MAG: OPT/YSL family transporter, partial [Planctomycetota bacterium]|nr:OPT/YSL family transporter [Planctomycetota bacterium]
RLPAPPPRERGEGGDEARERSGGLPLADIPAGLFASQKTALNGVAAQPQRTDYDMPIKYVFLILLVLVLSIGIFLYFYQQKLGTHGSFDIASVGTILAVIFGFFFVTVSARIVGIVGSSSSPVSGMTLTALMATALIFVLFGWTDSVSKILAMCVGSIICIAVCMSGDISQDLKTSYLVGATPYKIQIAEFIGVLAPAVAIAWVLLLLNETYGLGPGKKLEAPQATLLSMVLNGVIQGNLPWILIIVGIFIGLTVELLGIASLPFAIGLYLPFKLSAPLIIGGFVAWLVNYLTKTAEKEDTSERGVLFGSGLVAGDALVGIVIALLASVTIKAGSLAELMNLRGQIPDSTIEHLLGFGIFIVLSIILVLVAKSGSKGMPARPEMSGGVPQ